VAELIEDFINNKKMVELSERENLQAMMKLSETSFAEWDNEEDAISDQL